MPCRRQMQRYHTRSPARSARNSRSLHGWDLECRMQRTLCSNRQKHCRPGKKSERETLLRAWVSLGTLVDSVLLRGVGCTPVVPIRWKSQASPVHNDYVIIACSNSRLMSLAGLISSRQGSLHQSFLLHTRQHRIEIHDGKAGDATYTHCLISLFYLGIFPLKIVLTANIGRCSPEMFCDL